MKRGGGCDVAGGSRSFADEFVRAYATRFADYHLAWSVFFVAHMADLRRRLGSLDDALLLAAFGLGAVGEKARGPRRASRGSADFRADRVATNAGRLADLTCIPRETVRRRLAAFERRGWVAQNEDRSWRLIVSADGRAQVANDLALNHTVFVRQLAELMAAFERLKVEG